MDEILGSMDMPSGDGPNTYLVAKHTRQADIKVALSGLGGDELFAGYNKFFIYKKLVKYSWLLNASPAFIRRMSSGLLGSLIPGPKFNKLAHLYGLEKWDLSTLYPTLRRTYSNDQIKSLLVKPNLKDNVEQHLAEILPGISWMEDLSKCTIGELETYTRDVLLRDTDQMSMAHALEVRVPFFDYRLVEYLLSLPDEIKFPHTPKKLLVDALASRLPIEISQRRKMGFTLPMAHWLKNELAGMTESKIIYLADRKEFNATEVRNKWKNFQRGDKTVTWPTIWQLVVMSDWLERNQL
jgi:asparagine synthase (glutamine-hydrolysing)